MIDNKENSKRKTLDLIATGAAVLFAIGVIVFIIISFINSRQPKDDAVLPSEDEIFPMSGIIFSEANKEIVKTPSDTFCRLLTKDDMNIYLPKDGMIEETEHGAYVSKGAGEWYIYTTEHPYENVTVDCFKELAKSALNADNIIFEPSIWSDGLVGVSYGGYMTATLEAAGKEYYLMSYYLDDGPACAYMTSDKDKVREGYALITEDIMTMIDSAEILEGSDSGAPEEEELSDEYARELLNGAKYSSFTTKETFKKMRMIMTAEHFSDIDKIYIRRELDQSIIMPAEEEEHEDDEVVFVVDDVAEGETFQIVVFTDSEKVGGLRACAVEYEESEVVKAREGLVSDNSTNNDLQ